MIYKIKRNNWYYFSKRVEGKLFRMALRTKKRMVANNIVQNVIDKIEGTRVSIKVLKLIIEEEINRVIDKATALITPQSEQGKEEFNKYFNQHFTPNSLYNHNVQQAPLNYPIPEKQVLDFDDWIKDEIKPIELNHNIKQWLIDEGYMGYERDLVEQSTLITLLNKYVSTIKETPTTAISQVLDNLKQSFSKTTNTTHRPTEEIKSGAMTYSDALNKYKSNKDSYLYKTEKGKELAQKRIDEVLQWIDDFGSVVFTKEQPIADIDFSQFDEMLTTLSNFPKRSTLPFKHMSIEECLEMARSGETPEDVRQDKSLSRVKSMFNRFFSWLYDERFLDSNPVDNSRFKRFTDLSSRGAFNKTEQRTLRQYYDNLTIDDHSVCFYMQLFSGMRNKEILDLRAEDIRTDDDSGVLYFYVRGSKTKSAQRRVPVHKYLIERGVIEHIKVNDGLNTSASAISIKFTKLLRNLDISNINEQGHLLSFYSLRHVFMTSLVSYGATDTMINSVVGHKQTSTKDRYVDVMNIDLGELGKVIQRIPDNV